MLPPDAPPRPSLPHGADHPPQPSSLGVQGATPYISKHTALAPALGPLDPKQSQNRTPSLPHSPIWGTTRPVLEASRPRPRGAGSWAQHTSFMVTFQICVRASSSPYFSFRTGVTSSDRNVSACRKRHRNTIREDAGELHGAKSRPCPYWFQPIGSRPTGPRARHSASARGQLDNLPNPIFWQRSHAR